MGGVFRRCIWHDGRDWSVWLEDYSSFVLTASNWIEKWDDWTVYVWCYVLPFVVLLPLSGVFTPVARRSAAGSVVSCLSHRKMRLLGSSVSGVLQSHYGRFTKRIYKKCYDYSYVYFVTRMTPLTSTWRFSVHFTKLLVNSSKVCEFTKKLAIFTREFLCKSPRLKVHIY